MGPRCSGKLSHQRSLLWSSLYLTLDCSENIPEQENSKLSRISHYHHHPSPEDRNRFHYVSDIVPHYPSSSYPPTNRSARPAASILGSYRRHSSAADGRPRHPTQFRESGAEEGRWRSKFFGKNQRTRYQLDWRQVLLPSSRLRLGLYLKVGDSGPRRPRGGSVIAEVGDHEGLAIPQRIL